MNRFGFKIFIICITLTFHFKIFAKDIPISYFHHVDRAEMSIINHNYKEALMSYFLAFDIADPFVQDIYNAALCADLSNDKKRLKYCADLLAERGIGKQYFLKTSIFDQLKQDKDWENLLQKAAINKQKNDLSNSEIVEAINSLVDCDQFWHNKWAASDQDISSRLHDSVSSVDDSLSKELYALFENKGFISEFELGVLLEDDTTISIVPSYIIILIHAFEGQSEFSNILKAKFTDVLNRAVKMGRIKPEVVATIYDLNQDSEKRPYYGTGTGFLSLYKNSVYLFKSTKSEIDQIDINRKSLNLCSLNNYAKKSIYNLENPSNSFFISGSIARIRSFTDEASERTFLENRTLFIKID